MRGGQSAVFRALSRCFGSSVEVSLIPFCRPARASRKINEGPLLRGLDPKIEFPHWQGAALCRWQLIDPEGVDPVTDAFERF